MAVEVKFTKQQLEAINHDDGPCLVVAGAGTGKTAVITQRIARLILTKKAKPEEVLALTFTEKAASEMQQRVDEMLPYGYLDTQIMTFHALAERILREYALDAGLSTEFQILSDVQQTIILQEVLGRADFEYFSPQHDPFDFISAIKQAISRLKDEGIDSDTFQKLLLKNKTKLDLENLGAMNDLGQIYKKYSELCMAKNSLDFGDMLIKLQHLLKSRNKVKNELVERYRYVLVDEFQDTNSIQMDIITNLLGPSANIMVVGDDDQAIYRFRGASVQNILGFRGQFKDSKIIVLKDNFRSGQTILDAGYDLIQQNNPDRLEVAEGIDKKLSAHTHQGATVAVNEFTHKLNEIDGIVEKIESLINEGVESSEIAILLRKNNQLKSYIMGLQKKKIPYYVHQDVELFDQKSVKTMVNLANTICDPIDSASFFQLIISGFFKKVDRHEAIALSAQAKRHNLTLEETLRQSDSIEWASPLVELIDTWREQLADFSAGELLFLAIKSTGYLRDLLNKADSSVESALSIQYLTDFFKLVKQFELVSNRPNLAELCVYLDDIKLSSGDVMSDISPLDNNGVQLMTVHKAKGLEFDYVFIPELTEQIFPTYRQAEKLKIADVLLDPGKGDHYQEERRLFYVALTRARQFVQLSFATDHGGKRPKKPSRFIAESLGPEWQNKSIKSSQQTAMSELISSFEPYSEIKPKNSMLSRLFRGEWLYLNTNQIADYLRSPKEFWLFHVLCLPKGPFHTLVYGSAVHAALEHYYKFRLKSRPVSAAEVIEVFEKAWQSEGFASKEHEIGLFEQGKRVVAAYIESHKDDKLTPIAIEKPFELQLPEIKTVISGRYDIVFDTPEGTEIRDFKTSRVKDQKAADSKAKDSLQLGIYGLSWEKLQQKPIHATSLEFIEDQKVGKNININHEKTMELITKAVQGIKNMEFDEKGQSKMDFDKLLI